MNFSGAYKYRAVWLPCLQIDALSEIVDTVQGRIEIYLDGGIRTGSDVLKALALGARCVFIGRPAVWGLAYKVRSFGVCACAFVCACVLQRCEIFPLVS